MGIDIPCHICIRVSHQILQVLDCHSGIGHIGAKGVPQNMGRDGWKRIVRMELSVLLHSPLHMMLNVVFGGKGVGLMNMIMYAILAVFICGLMIGRTPEYLGKKIEGREMKLTALCIIIHPLLILAFSALAVSTNAGLDGISNPGFHGLSQILYEYASSSANNGSGFEGLIDNSYFWNITTGLAMFFGRYISIWQLLVR